MAARRAVVVPVVVATVIGLLFVTVFLAAFFDPRPRGLPVAVAGPTEAVEQLRDEAEDRAPGAFELVPVADRSAAEAEVRSADAAAALVLGERPEILVAGAAGPGAAGAVTGAFADALAQEGSPPRVVDVVPATPGDERGLVVFYVAFGVVLGGFLYGVVAATTGGALPRVQRVGAVLATGVVLGVLTAVVAVVAFDALPAPFGIATLVVSLLAAAVAAGTSAFVRLVGPAGVGLGSIVLLILGNATSGATLPPEFLPDWLRWLHPVLPAGAAVDALRGAAHFDGAGVATGVAVLVVWVVAGCAIIALVPGRPVVVDTSRGQPLPSPIP